MLRPLHARWLRSTGGFHPEALTLALGPGLDDDACARIAHEGRVAGFPSMRLAGEEPLARPGLARLLPRLTSQIPVVLATDGLALEACAATVEAQVREVEIAVVGADEEEWARERGEKGLGRVQRGVRALRGRVRMWAEIAVTTGNAGSLERIVAMVGHTGFTGFRVYAATPIPELRPALERLARHPLLAQPRDQLLRAAERDGAPSCAAPWTRAEVDDAQGLRPCAWQEPVADARGGLEAAIAHLRPWRRRFEVRGDPVCRRCRAGHP